MARKMDFDINIFKDIKSVASDTFKDNVKMIEIENLKPGIDNFYQISEIEILAEDIERQGLKHNLVVSEDKDDIGKYFIKSGHRRYNAIKKLIQENKITSKSVPCFIDGVKTKSQNLLDLIMLNATSRIMSDAELIQQYDILDKTFKELELEGNFYKGRMREKISKALNISSAQVGKIENIKNNAVEEIKEAVKAGEISISTANNIAKLSDEKQKDFISEKNISEIKNKEVVKEVQKEKEQKIKPEKNIEEKSFEDNISEDDFFDYKEEKEYKEIDDIKENKLEETKDIKFKNEVHKERFFELLSKIKTTDSYLETVCYLFSLNADCFKSINDLFDFEDSATNKNIKIKFK